DFVSKIKNHDSTTESLLELREARENRSLYHLIFNRLNHRKLFYVESPTGETCFILGGRNLGDHYLHWEMRTDSFVDGDMLICDHHLDPNKKDDNVVAQASESFDEIFYAKDDGLRTDDPLHDPDHPLIFKVKPNP